MKNIFFDCKWFPNQKIFIIGYAYNLNSFGQLYDSSITKKNFINLLKPVNGYIFFYGPDIGILEKFFLMDIRHNYNCVNLMPIFSQFTPLLNSHRLCDLEKTFGLKRSSAQYKKNIRLLIEDWKNPDGKKNALKYNQEDVLNLIRLKNIIFKNCNIPKYILPDYMLK